MEPKLKAKELVRRFMPYVYGIGNMGDGIHKHNAKECAVILCDEMIKHCEYQNFDYVALSLLADQYKFATYWQQVRTEIEKL